MRGLDAGSEGCRTGLPWRVRGAGGPDCRTDPPSGARSAGGWPDLVLKGWGGPCLLASPGARWQSPHAPGGTPLGPKTGVYWPGALGKGTGRVGPQPLARLYKEVDSLESVLGTGCVFARTHPPFFLNIATLL